MNTLLKNSGLLGAALGLALAACGGDLTDTTNRESTGGGTGDLQGLTNAVCFADSYDTLLGSAKQVNTCLGKTVPDASAIQAGYACSNSSAATAAPDNAANLFALAAVCSSLAKAGAVGTALTTSGDLTKALDAATKLDATIALTAAKAVLPQTATAGSLTQTALNAVLAKCKIAVSAGDPAGTRKVDQTALKTLTGLSGDWATKAKTSEFNGVSNVVDGSKIICLNFADAMFEKAAAAVTPVVPAEGTSGKTGEGKSFTSAPTETCMMVNQNLGHSLAVYSDVELTTKVASLLPGVTGLIFQGAANQDGVQKVDCAIAGRPDTSCFVSMIGSPVSQQCPDNAWADKADQPGCWKVAMTIPSYNTLNVRSSADFNSNVVGSLTNGKQVNSPTPGTRVKAPTNTKTVTWFKPIDCSAVGKSGTCYVDYEALAPCN